MGYRIIALGAIGILLLFSAFVIGCGDEEDTETVKEVVTDVDQQADDLEQGAEDKADDLEQQADDLEQGAEDTADDLEQQADELEQDVRN
jgi:methyl-accepting chemotaxis protein